MVVLVNYGYLVRNLFGYFSKLNRELCRVCSKTVLSLAGVACERNLNDVVSLIKLKRSNAACICCFWKLAGVTNAKLYHGAGKSNVVLVDYGYLICNLSLGLFVIGLIILGFFVLGFFFGIGIFGSLFRGIRI